MSTLLGRIVGALLLPSVMLRDWWTPLNFESKPMPFWRRVIVESTHGPMTSFLVVGMFAPKRHVYDINSDYFLAGWFKLSIRIDRLHRMPMWRLSYQWLPTRHTWIERSRSEDLDTQ